MVSGTGCITRRSRPRAAQTGGLVRFSRRDGRGSIAGRGGARSPDSVRVVLNSSSESEGRRHALPRQLLLREQRAIIGTVTGLLYGGGCACP